MLINYIPQALSNTCVFIARTDCCVIAFISILETWKRTNYNYSGSDRE